jgi:aspartyl-tRNA(Asn)/glutamyl-tRNA(Gln) amidotransferase subunit C
LNLSKADVLHVARLSALALTEAEADRMTGEISAILNYVEGLSVVDIPDESQDGAALSPTLLATDTPSPSLSPEGALAGAPDRSGSFFRVPRILEEGR